MSAQTAPSTETVVHVRPRSEGVDVWRPGAQRFGPSTFRLSRAPIPADGEWALQPDDVVVAEPGDASASGDLIAAGRVSGFDPRSQAHLLAS